MQCSRLASVLFLPLLCGVASAAGFAHDENFIVFTGNVGTLEEQEIFAQQVLAQANAYRAEIAREWLGEALPDGAGRTVINIDFSNLESSALTWAIDHPDRTMHSVFITATSHDQALRGVLRHEITHVVLATAYPHPNRMPTWFEEGIASRYDDADRTALRVQAFDSAARSGDWPELSRLLQAESLSPGSHLDYAASASLVEFLLSRANRDVLLQFAQDAPGTGWNAALEKHYGIANVEQLQTSWQDWVLRRERIALRD